MNNNGSFERRRMFEATCTYRGGAETRLCLCTFALHMEREVGTTVLKKSELARLIDKIEIGDRVVGVGGIGLVNIEMVVIASSVGDGSRGFHTDASSIPATSPLTRVASPKVSPDQFTKTSGASETAVS